MTLSSMDSVGWASLSFFNSFVKQLCPACQAGHHRNEFGRLDWLGGVHLETGQDRLGAVLGTGIGGEGQRGRLAALSGAPHPDPADERVADEP